MKFHHLPILFMASTSLPAVAQSTAPAPTSRAEAAQDTADEEPEIVVTGQRERGAVPGDIKPELQLRAADVRSYGVSSIAELLGALSPQVQGGKSGPPVVLLNGQRISSFSEIRDLPTEAISRVDILPEEVALKYGYAAGQKVVNIVLRQRFRAITGELSDTYPIDGDANSPQAEANLLRIRKDGRFTLNLKYNQRDALLESQRDVIDPAPPSPFDPAGRITSLSPFRTLTPATKIASANAVFNKTVFGNVAATINGTIDVANSSGLRGLPRLSLIIPPNNPFANAATPVTLTGIVPGIPPLTQESQAVTGHAGVTLSNSTGKWRWNFTANYDHSDTRTLSDAGIDRTALQAAINAGDPTLNPLGSLPANLLTRRPFDRAIALSNSGTVDLLVSGSPFKLPAGDVSTSVRIGGQITQFDNNATRLGIASRASLSRNIGSGQINVDLPVSSRKAGVLAAIGDISLNGNVAARQVSGFGTLTTLGYGFVWSPVKPLNLVVSMTDDQQAPTVQQIANPQISTFGVPVFDFANGTSVLVTQISGGNPALLAPQSHSFKAEANWKPISGKDLTLIATYQRGHTNNAVSGFPIASAAIQTAFPERFVRDANGNLSQIDTRPINFARTDDESVRWGLNFSKPIKSRQLSGPDVRAMFGNRGPGGADRLPGGGDRGERRGGGGFGGGQGGRIQLALYHTWNLRDTVLIRSGLPTLDRLNGGATNSGGGQPRHEIEAQAGISQNGIGARISANWQSGTTINGPSGLPIDRLNFASLGTVDLRLFVNLGAQPSLVRDHPWLRGTRITLSFNNLFDGHQRVTDSNGLTPLSYQPAYLDPIGSSVRLSIRKVFF